MSASTSLYDRRGPSKIMSRERGRDRSSAAEALVMDEVTSAPRSPKPFLTVAAWLSLLVPLLAGGWVYYSRTIPNPRLSKGDLAVLALVFGVSFVAGCVSLWGVRA